MSVTDTTQFQDPKEVNEATPWGQSGSASDRWNNLVSQLDPKA